MSVARVPTAEGAVLTDASATVKHAVTIDHAAREGCSVSHDVPEIGLVHPLPGFPDLTRYVLVRLEADGAEGADGVADADGAAGPTGEALLYELRSVERPEVRFLVVAPTAFFPDYTFELDESACAELGLTAPDDALVLVLLTIGDDAASTTANLLAPVVINARTRSAAQVILSGTDWPVRAAVV